jgi:predicted HTH transcriptional regulator
VKKKPIESYKNIFISSVQKELQQERRALKEFVEGDALLRRYFSVFLFEDLPASDRKADNVYLEEVEACDVYVGLFGNEYGNEDNKGISPTEREFNLASAKGKTRLIFVKGMDDKSRHPKMLKLIRKAGSQLIRKRFKSVDELTKAFYASLVDYLEVCGIIQARHIEDRPCQDAATIDIDARAVENFVRLARLERQFPLPIKTPVADVLAHLHLLCDDHPTNAAILLFGRDPQRFLPASEVRCMHFHGTEIQRPVPFYRIFKGTLFEQVDMAMDFVVSKLNRSVGTRAESAQAPVRYEIPPDVIREAVVNAVAHRDYTSGGAVQVSVFADRVEVWNPGTLTPPLTPECLRQPHGSIARNPRICEALFLARYIEKYGTGTLMMIRECLAHALPEPDFIQRGGEFTITVWRDWLTDEVMKKLDLNNRQVQAVAHAKTTGRISTGEYRGITKVSESTALRELRQLTKLGVFEKVGGSGRAAHYIVAKTKPVIKPSNPSRKR